MKIFHPKKYRMSNHYWFIIWAFRYRIDVFQYRKVMHAGQANKPTYVYTMACKDGIRRYLEATKIERDLESNRVFFNIFSRFQNLVWYKAELKTVSKETIILNSGQQSSILTDHYFNVSRLLRIVRFWDVAWSHKI